MVGIGCSGSEIPLGHARLLRELEMHAKSDDRTRFLHIDSATTTRWEQHVSPQIPFMTNSLGFTRNDEQVQKSFEDWSQGKNNGRTIDYCLQTWVRDRKVCFMI